MTVPQSEDIAKILMKNIEDTIEKYKQGKLTVRMALFEIESILQGY